MNIVENTTTSDSDDNSSTDSTEETTSTTTKTTKHKNNKYKNNKYYNKFKLGGDNNVISKRNNTFISFMFSCVIALSIGFYRFIPNNKVISRNSFISS